MAPPALFPPTRTELCTPGGRYAFQVQESAFLDEFDQSTLKMSSRCELKQRRLRVSTSLPSLPKGARTLLPRESSSSRSSGHTHMSDEADRLNEEGKARFKEKRYTEAYALFTRSLSAGAPSKLKAQVLGNRAAALSFLGRHEEALLDGKAAQAADPTYIKAYYRQAKTLLDELSRPAEALAAARAGLMLQSKNPQLRELMRRAERAVEVGVGSGDGDESESDSGESDDESDEESDANTDEGGDGVIGGGGGGGASGTSASPMDVDDPASAEAAAESAKESGNRDFKSGKYESAAMFYGRAMRLRPANPTYPSNRAAALLSCGRAAEALEAAQQAIDLDPTMIKAHMRYARALLTLGRFSDARRGEGPPYPPLYRIQQMGC